MLFKVAAAALLALSSAEAFSPTITQTTRPVSASTHLFQAPSVNENVLQTENTSRDKVMTFSYDMSLEPKYEKPTYPGTGNGMSGDSGEYDVIVIGSGMGGLTCGAISAKYGDKVLVLESHIKCGGSAHTFSRMHKGEKYSFEVGPSIFEGLDRPSLNPLRMIFDLLDEKMPVKTYTGLGYWTPKGYWRFPIGSQSKFEDLLMAQAEDGPLAVKVCYIGGRRGTEGNSTNVFNLLLTHDASSQLTFAGMERASQTSQDTGWFDDSRVSFESPTRRGLSRHHSGQSTLCSHAPRCLFRSPVDL